MFKAFCEPILKDGVTEILTLPLALTVPALPYAITNPFWIYGFENILFLLFLEYLKGYLVHATVVKMNFVLLYKN